MVKIQYICGSCGQIVTGEAFEREFRPVYTMDSLTPKTIEIKRKKVICQNCGERYNFRATHGIEEKIINFFGSF